MTETCRLKLETTKFTYIFISAFVGIARMDETLISARYGTHKTSMWSFARRGSKNYETSQIGRYLNTIVLLI